MIKSQTKVCGTFYATYISCMKNENINFSQAYKIALQENSFIKK